MFNRRVIHTILWLSAYIAAVSALAATPWFVLPQIALLLLPVFTLLIGLAWTTPYPDYAATPEMQTPPIEDLDPPARRVMWLNGWWEFRLAADRRWRRFHVPGSWNTIRGIEYYEGEARFRRLFTVPEGWSRGRVALQFRGVNYSAVVSIDGREVGRHDGGYTPFSIDITDRIAEGRQYELEVLVSNRLSRSTVPAVVGWRNEGGILREVYLETMARVYIASVTAVCAPDLKGRCKALINLRVENPDWTPRDYHIEVFSPQGALVHEYRLENWSMQNIEHELDITFVSLWSPDNPALYTCRVTLLGEDEDQYVIQFGARKVEIIDNRIHLNGAAITLRGTTRMEDHPDTGAVETLAAIKKDLQHIKDAGFNLVRLGPRPAHPKVLEMCDRLGLLAIEEIPVWFGMSFDLVDPAYQQTAESMLREMIQRDINHPCVLMWGLAHGIDNESREGRWFMEHLVKVARGLDDRPLYMVVDGAAGRDLCAELVDALVYLQWERRAERIATLDSALAEWREHAPGKPLLAAYGGLPALRGATLRAGAGWTEERQARFLQQFVTHCDGHDIAAGWLFGTLTDHRDPGNLAGPIPFMRLSGILNHWREPKIAYDVLKSLLVEKKTVSIPLKKRILPITSFSKIIAVLVCLISGVLWFRVGPPATSLFYNPAEFISQCLDSAYIVLLLVMALNSVSWAVLLNRFLKAAPRRLLGAINMPYYMLLSLLMRSEAIMCAWVFLTFMIFWTFSTTVLHFAIFPGREFAYAAAVSAALVVPDAVFAVPAFFRLPLMPFVFLFHLWKALVCWFALGPAATVIYVFISPYILVAIVFVFAEVKFHITKYLRKMLKL